MKTLDHSDRIRLLRFVCSFAWADLEVQPQEREFVRRLVRRLDVLPGERAEVEAMLAHPPAPEDIDPTDVPYEHRKLFVTTIKNAVLADGVIDPAEAENLDLFEQLLEM